MQIDDDVARQKAIQAYKTLPAETIKTGDNTVVVRFKRNGRKQLDFYMKKVNGKWLFFDYAQNGVHTPRNMRKTMRQNQGVWH